MYGLVTYVTPSGKYYRHKVYSPYLLEQFLRVIRKKNRVVSIKEEWK